MSKRKIKVKSLVGPRRNIYKSLALNNTQQASFQNLVPNNFRSYLQFMSAELNMYHTQINWWA